MAESETIEISVPKVGNDEIVMDCGSENIIGMSLPAEAENAEGIKTDNGTIVYDTDEDVAVAVQVLSEEQDGMTFEAVRTMVAIENSSAPKEYEFDFNLPKGYSLVKDTEYNDEFDEYDCGAIYIINENGESINTIDPAWAKDANGRDVETYYKIKGNTLIQVVAFNEDTAFPIVADPTSHPNKNTYIYYTKKQVKKIRDQYTNVPSFKDIIEGSIEIGCGFAGYAASGLLQIIGVLGTAWGVIDFMGTCYNVSKYNVWNKIYTEFEKNYAKVTLIWKYHPGKRCYGPTGKLKATYVLSKE